MTEERLLQILAEKKDEPEKYRANGYEYFDEILPELIAQNALKKEPVKKEIVKEEKVIEKPVEKKVVHEKKEEKKVSIFNQNKKKK